MGTNINFNKVLGISKGCSIKLPLNLLLLDTYPNAAVAYSLRKLRTAYSGSAIQVRREADNTTQDIGFNSTNDLDIPAITSFAGNNLMAQSESFSTGSWAKTNSVVTASVIAAPVGVGLADKLDENIANGQHTIQQSVGILPSGTTYFFSVYLKADQRNIVEFVSGVTGTNQVARVSLLTGAILSASPPFPTTPTMTSVGGGWWKFEILLPANLPAGGVGIQIRLTNGSTHIYTGTTGFGCYVWGAQMSGYTGSPVPYFKTTANRASAVNVTKWYDQSGNGNNAEQTAVLDQAAIFTNGFLNLDAITNKITTTWTNDVYTLATGINPNTKYLSIGVVNRTANTNNIVHIGVAGTFAGVNGQVPLAWFATTGNVFSGMYSSFNHGINTSTGAFITTSQKNASDLKTVYLNGTALALTSTEATSTGTNINSFGQTGGNFANCQYQEYIYWNSEQSANRVAIETNINTYWTIYP
jgi:hypothetical protein